MHHIDEHILELYVLDAKEVEERRDEIEMHLHECHGCRALVEEIKEFHSDLAIELESKPDDLSSAETAIVRSRQAIEPFYDPDFPPIPYVRKTPVEKFRYLVRRHPIAAGVGSFSTLAVLAFALSALMNPSKSVRSNDTNPYYTFLNSSNGTFEVYNKKNEKLWSRPLSAIGLKVGNESYSSKRHRTLDLNDDGRNEVITTYHLDGEPPVAPKGLHVFDGSGNYMTSYQFQSQAKFNETLYMVPVEISDESPFLVDTIDNPKSPNILIRAHNERSPNVILRMNLQGKILGEYWHYGAIAGLSLRDINGDGSKELILFGINDVNDDIKLSKPVIFVLDPRKIVGVTESSRSRGFGRPVSEAEIYYIQLPLSDLNVIEHRNAFVVQMAEDNHVLRFDCATGVGDIPYKFEYIFTSNLQQPLEVKSTTVMTEYYAKLKIRGIFSRSLDKSYLDSLKNEIRYWDGKELRKEVVKVHHTEILP